MPPPDVPVSLAAADWNFALGTGFGSSGHPTTNDTPPGWHFDWPTTPNVSYLYTDYPFDISGLSTVSFDVTMTKDMGTSYVFDGPGPSNPCLTAPNIGVVLIRYQDFSEGRWWSLDRLTLGEGTTTLSTDLTDLSKWVDVNGIVADSSADATARFMLTLQAVGQIGFTVGGGCFLGHGAWIDSGSARFTVTDFQVQ